MTYPWRRPPKVEKKISVLIPFGGHSPYRRRVLDWLLIYWESHLCDFEIIIGHDTRSDRTWRRRHPLPFSKSAAVNDAFSRSTGDIIAIIDADCYLDADIVMHWAERLRAQRRAGVKSWAVPYRFLLRINEHCTDVLLGTNPRGPFHYPHPPHDECVEGTDGSGWGHVYGALAQIMPREAYLAVGGMPEKFRGWGGEDRAFLQALNTLWGHYRNSPNTVYHLWHPKIVAAEGIDEDGKRAEIRAWDGQGADIRANDWLSTLYQWADGNPDRMRKIIDGKTP